MTEHVGHAHSAASRFTRSVNVQQDVWQAESLEGYLVTAGARGALLRIAPALHSSKAARAWTLTGPYGTGKSSLANFAAKLLGGEVVPGHAAAWKLLRASDAELAQMLSGKLPSPVHGRGAGGEGPALLPIVITGSREPLQLAILRGLQAAIGHLGGRRCSQVMASIDELLAQAASGKQPSAHAITELFGQALQAACATEKVGGFFLVVDELGKLLEYAAAHPANSDLYTLQALAEFAARTPQPFLILSILHQDFSLYADRLTGRERAEWDKIRGRFEDIAFEEPVDELLRLIAEARSQSPDGVKLEMLPSPAGRTRQDGRGRAPCTHGRGEGRLQSARRKHFRSLCEQAWQMDLAPQRMDKAEFCDILARCYPLHPLAALVLGPLFRKLAQNERSVFSFLESGEPHGLRDFLQTPDGRLYGIHQLYDYLLGSIGKALYVQLHGKRWAEIETVLASLSEATALDAKLVKTIGLLGAMGPRRNLLATEKIVRFALCDAPTRDIGPALHGLRSKKSVVYRRFNRSFSLWEGSDFDLDQQIRDARGRVDPSKGTAALAAQFITPRPLVAKRHSFTTGSLRYFEVRFVGPSELADIVQQPRTTDDGQILILLPDAAASGDSMDKLASDSRLRDRPDILVVVPAETRSLEDNLHELASLEWIRSNAPGLDGDATARRELRARIAAQRRCLDERLSPILAPEEPDVSASAWYHRGRKRHLASRKGLQDYLSCLCDETYPSTPHIRNELINRRELSSAAAAARRNLIEGMIEHGDQPDLGIAGTPPEKSMYLSVLRQTGIHRKAADGCQFSAPARDGDGGLREVWHAITAFFSQSEREAAPIAALYERLASPPYGMLAGPMHVLLCAALLANNDRVALYEEGSFIPNLNSAAFERLLRAPELFSVQQWRLTGVRTTVFHRLAGVLNLQVSDAAPDKDDILTVVRPLCRFVANLNDYVRRTERLSPVAQKIRDHLTAATRPDKLVFEDLPSACGVPPITSRARLGEDVLSRFITTA
jgi:hypothetical protein